MFIDIAWASTEESTTESTESGHATTEASSDAGLLGSLGINGQLFLFQVINFAIVMVVLWYLILKPITKKMAERQKLIDDSIDNSKKVEDNLRRSEKAFQEKVDEAKVESNRIIEKASTEAEKLSADLKEKAKKEIETLVETARRNIKNEKAAMSAELKAETAGLVVAALEKILSGKLDDKKDKQFIEEILSTLK